MNFKNQSPSSLAIIGSGARSAVIIFLRRAFGRHGPEMKTEALCIACKSEVK